MFSFLMKYDSLTFPEAAKVLADRAGIDVPDIEISDEKRHEADLKNNIYEINAKAARYFHYLLGTKDGDAAKAYFAKRELEDKTVTSFGLGFHQCAKMHCTSISRKKAVVTISLRKQVFLYMMSVAFMTGFATV